MKYNFDKIIPREGTFCEKFDMRESIFGRADVIPLWVADMDFEVAPEIIGALRKRLDHPILGYSYRGKGYYDSICGWLSRRNGWSIRPEWIDFTPGVVPGIGLALRALTAERDGIVIQPPVYHPFARQIRRYNRAVINNPIRFDNNRFEIDFEDLDRKLAGAKAFLMSNPHNPTGRVFTREELTRIGELCVKHDVLILSDEIHADIIFQPHRHISIASLEDAFAERTLTFLAPSKTFNIAGLSTSVVITPNDSLRRRLKSELDRANLDQGNIFGTLALEAAYTYGDQWVDEMTAYVSGNIDYVIGFLGEHIPSIKTLRPDGTYLMWLDFRQWPMTHKEVFRFLVEQAGLGLNEGEMFGEGGTGFMRMNMATRRSVIEQAMRQLLDAYRKFQ